MAKMSDEGCKACGAPENWKTLLLEAHEILDDLNASELKINDVCYFCHVRGYNGKGILHTDNCILIKIRQVLG
jgi:hypothetical protein